MVKAYFVCQVIRSLISSFNPQLKLYQFFVKEVKLKNNKVFIFKISMKKKNNIILNVFCFSPSYLECLLFFTLIS